jgi:tetratricopeptide (TPR) repeat protein
MQNVVISVSEAGSAAAKTLAVEVRVQGKVASDKTLSPVETQEVGETASQYLSLLQEPARSDGSSYLSILADTLFRLFLKDAWQEIKIGLSSAEETELTVASELAEVLILPWQHIGLSSHTEGLLSRGIGTIRCPRALGEPEVADAMQSFIPPPGPLRLLFLAAGPGGTDGDEEAALAAAEGVDAKILVCESGTAEELKSLAGSFRPHLVILAGQAKMAGGRAAFSLPGRAGRGDLLAADDLAAALKESDACGLILTGRQSEALPLHMLGIAVAGSIPLVIAWDATVADAVRLLCPLAKGSDLSSSVRALMAGRDLSASTKPWPHLYTLFYPSRLFDGSLTGEKAASICKKQDPLPGTDRGWAKCFVDRRQELQKLAPALADGSVQSLIITGPEGSGKSSLAACLAAGMASLGYSIMTVCGFSYNPITAARLIDAAAAHFSATGREEAAKPLKDGGISVKKRLEGLLEALKGSRTLLVWDGLTLEEKSGKISDPDLAAFYLQMNRGLSSSRAIITSAALPADAPTLPARAWQWKLVGLGRAAFVRSLLGEEAVAEGYRRGRISFAQLAEHHAAASGLPALLAQTAKALASAAKAELPFSAGEDPALRLISLLEPDARQALLRAAVFEIAVSPAGLAPVSGSAEEAVLGYATRWQDLSLAFPMNGRWSVPRPVRSSLIAALTVEEQRAAHRAAGGFLRDLAQSGRSAEVGLSRLDVLLEARGHLLSAHDGAGAADVTASISGYLLRRGYRAELIRQNHEVLASLNEIGQDTPDIAGITGWVARAYLDGEEFRQAEQWYRSALENARAPASSHHHGLGLSLLHQGKHDAARASLQKAVEGFRSANDPLAEAVALGSLAALQMKLGENDSARESLSQIAGLMKTAGDVQGEAAAWQDISRLDMVKGDLNAAREGLVRSLQLLRGAGDRSGSSIALFNLASLDLEKGDFAAAGAEFQEALPFFEERADQSGTAAIHHSLGMIHTQAGEKEKAKQSFLSTLTLSQKLGDKAAEAGAFFQLGVLAVQQNHGAEGLRLMALASVLLRSIKSDEVKNVEPLVERLAAQLGYSQEQFLVMVQEVFSGYARDRGRALAEKA